MSSSPPLSTVRAECLDCGHIMPFAPMQLKCERCGSEWLDATYDYDSLRDNFFQTLETRDNSLWRYRALLPVRDPSIIISLGEGNTPLIPLPNLSMMLARPHLFAKDERQNPSTSFKDRQASVAVSIMKEAGLTDSVVASTGNVAIAYASYCARAGIKLYAFLTSLVPPEKMRECALYGAQVIKLATTYDQSKVLAEQFARQRNIYYDRGLRSIASVESMKTLAYEVAEQLGFRMPTESGAPWRAPDWYIQSVSGGLGPVGTMKGFRELYRLGLIDKVPALACIQVDGCPPMVNAFKANSDTPFNVSNPRTKIATLATGSPGRAYTLLKRHIEKYGGAMESVSDDDAFRTMHVMAKMEGLSMEPASAVAFAGLFKLIQMGVIKPDESVVVAATGHTVPVYSEVLGENWAKDVELSQEAVAQPRSEGIMAALDELDERVRSIVIVDDTPDAVRLLKRILQAKGQYQIYEASNGREGLNLIRDKHPNLVLLDLMMPEMDGFAVLDALRADEKTRDIPVIVITAKVLTPEERARLKNQADSLLQKGSFMDDDALENILNALQ